MIPELRESLRTASATKYLWEVRRYVAVIAAFFILSVAFYTVFYDTHPDVREPDYQEVREQVTAGKSDNHLILAGQILLNNCIAAVLSTLSGVAWGIGPVYASMNNARAIGLVYAQLIAVKGMGAGSLYLAAGILPHGIIELSAFFISAGMGLKLGVMAIQDSYNDIRAFLAKTPKEVRKEAARQNDRRFYAQCGGIIKVFVYIVLPALVLAAAIEGFITPILLGML